MNSSVQTFNVNIVYALLTLELFFNYNFTNFCSCLSTNSIPNSIIPYYIYFFLNILTLSFCKTNHYYILCPFQWKQTLSNDCMFNLLLSSFQTLVYLPRKITYIHIFTGKVYFLYQIISQEPVNTRKCFVFTFHRLHFARAALINYKYVIHKLSLSYFSTRQLPLQGLKRHVIHCCLRFISGKPYHHHCRTPPTIC